MTASSNTILFNTKDATSYYEPISGLTTRPHYIVAARSIPWTDEENPPDIETNSGFTDYDIWDEFVFGKLIQSGDAALMINRYDWTYNTIYDIYDPQDQNLRNKRFYAFYQEANDYHVFKCLDNANGSPSQYQPRLSETSISDSQYYTADGYHWKYCFTIDNATFTKFATNDFIPAMPNTAAQAAASNGSIDAIHVDVGGASYIAYANGLFSSIAYGGNTQIFGISSGSSNNNFYTGSCLYISSGPGAGQIKEITNYSISGNNLLVTVNSAFTTIPDLSSAYQISPKVEIFGDGVGALAVSFVNTATQAIQSVKMIDEGINYTYANVSISGNTGGLSVSNTAILRPMISPPGGHGSNILSEFYANKLGISVNFSNTDVNIPTNGSYRRIVLMESPKYNDVILSIANATGTFIAGEIVVQNVANTLNISTIETDTYQYSNIYQASKYNVLQFTAPVSFANDNVVLSGNTSGVIINRISNNSFLVRRDSDPVWSNSSVVLLSSNSSVNGTISSITSGLSSGVIFGRDDANTLFTYDYTTDLIKVFVDNTAIIPVASAAPSDPQFSINSTAITISNKAISNSVFVYIDRYAANTTQEQLISNTELYISGTITSTNSTSITLTGVNGLFQANQIITGTSSTSEANVVSVSGQDISFDQRTKLVGTYQIGSLDFSVSNTVYQMDSSNNVIAFGTIHSISNTGNTYSLYLTNIKGTIESSSNTENKYIQSISGDKMILISEIDTPNIQKYSGTILYAENMIPVTRTPIENEVIRLVLSFY